MDIKQAFTKEKSQMKQKEENNRKLFLLSLPKTITKGILSLNAKRISKIISSNLVN